MGDEIDFYTTYNDFKSYATPVLKGKHMRQFDREFWHPTACSADMAVLEIGCGAGLFLSYLKEEGVTDLLGIDQNPELVRHLPVVVAGNFVNADVWQFVAEGAGGRRFQRIAMFDVLEHFTPRRRRPAAARPERHPGARRARPGAGPQRRLAVGRPGAVRRSYPQDALHAGQHAPTGPCRRLHLHCLPAPGAWPLVAPRHGSAAARPVVAPADHGARNMDGQLDRRPRAEACMRWRGRD